MGQEIKRALATAGGALGGAVENTLRFIDPGLDRAYGRYEAERQAFAQYLETLPGHQDQAEREAGA
jgi:hypothetical protein